MRNLSVFGDVFSEIKKCWHFEFSWMKYFGNDFSFLIKWHIWVYYCWNYGPSNLKAELKVDLWLQIGIYSRKCCPRHGSGQLPPANRWWTGDVVLMFLILFWNQWTSFPCVSVANFEYVFWLSTLWAKLYNCQAIVLEKRDFTWNFSLAFQQSQLERVWMTFKLSNTKLHHWYLLILIKF